MQNLYFGRRARRRQRLKRFVVPAWLLSVAALALGIPGAESGSALLSLLDDRSIAVVHAMTNPPSRDQIGANENTEATLRFRRATFNSRPAPEPSPSEPATGTTVAPAPAPGGSITEIIYAAAAEFGIDGGYLLGVAQCESTLNPQAHNPAGYHGLFQYDSGTWAAYGYGSIYDPVAQARTTARLLAMGQSSRWPNCA